MEIEIVSIHVIKEIVFKYKCKDAQKKQIKKIVVEQIIEKNL